MLKTDIHLPIKIGLDIHGVINENPKFWLQFMDDLRTAKGIYWQVHILTGHSVEKAETELEEFNIYPGHYATIFSISDYLAEKGVPEQSRSSKSTPWYPSEQWNSAKAEYVKKEGIQILIDDSKEYAEHMPKGALFLAPIRVGVFNQEA